MDATFKKIVLQLSEKTKEGKVNWRTGNTSNEYCLLLPESTVSIGVYQSGGIYFVECKILNTRGDIILRENVLQTSEDGAFLVEFFTLVRDAYTGKDRVLSALFDHIEQDPIIGAPEDNSEELPF